jgi:hypothetical protein
MTSAAGRRFFCIFDARFRSRRAGVHHPAVMVYSRYMAAKKTTLKELGEMLAHVVKHMVTKDDLAEAVEKLDDRLTAVESKIGGIDTKLTKFEESEIDKRLQLEVRVTTIEKHLGFDKKIAA